MPLILDIKGWIVTLDVLKSIININVLPLRFSWIVTLDVLKYFYLKKHYWDFQVE